MPNLPDNQLMDLHRDLAEANGALKEMQSTMRQILNRLDTFGVALDNLNTWKAGQAVESRVANEMLATIRRDLDSAEKRIQDQEQTIAVARGQLRLVWAIFGPSTIAAFVAAFRDQIFGK